MRTRTIIRSMLTALFLLMAVQTVQAQDAFYIYRNDGDFNGFFYDQVKRMSYSKLDLEGNEHDVYVVQEVETDDSLYRIPLIAIDSVSFQQPEIRFSSRYKNLDEMGVTPYVTIDDRWYWTISFPKGSDHYIPKIGDVLVGFDEKVYGDGGMSGKIYDIEDESDAYNDIYMLNLENLTDFSDVFDQYITAERVYIDQQGKVRRQIAGCDENGMPYNSSTRSSGGGSMNLIDFSTGIQRTWTPKEGVDISLGASIGLTVGLTATYNITWRRVFIKLENPASFKLTPKISVTASKSFDVLVDGLPKFLKSIKFPAAAPIFETLPLPELYIRGGGSLDATITFPSVGFGVKSTFIIDTAAKNPLQFSFSKDASGNEASPDAIDTTKGSVTLSGWLQTALKLSANIQTCSWFEDLLFCRLGLDFYVGPKVEGNLKLETDFIHTAPNVFLKGMKLTLTPIYVDMGVNGTLGYLFKDKEEHKLLNASLSFFPVEFSTIPTLKKIDYTATDWQNSLAQGTVTVDLTTEGLTFVPTRVGAQLVNVENKYFDLHFDTSSHFFTDKEKKSTVTFDNVPVGVYPIIPYYKTIGLEYEADFPEDTPVQKAYVLPSTFTHALVGAKGLMVGKIITGDNTEDYRNERYDHDWTAIPIQCNGSNGSYTISGTKSYSWTRQDESMNAQFSGTRTTELSFTINVIDGVPCVVSGNIKEVVDRKSVSSSISSRHTNIEHDEYIMQLEGVSKLPLSSILTRPTDETYSELWDKDWNYYFNNYPDITPPTYGSVGFGGATPNVVVTENHTEDYSGASYDAYKETWVSYSGHKSQSYHNEGNMSIGLTLGF